MKNTNVLIVGAGPVGLFSALLLAKRGISCTVVERYPSPLQAPKAHVINPRSLEIFKALGLDVDAMRAKATRREDSQLVRFHTTLAGRGFTPVPYERQDEAVLDVTPTPLMSLPQPELEKFLGDQVTKESRITVQRECVWKSVEQRDGRCYSTLESAGKQHVLESHYVLACDGAGSNVRDALGIGLTGFPEGMSCLNIHFHANLRHIVKDRTAIIYWIINPEIAGALIAHDIDHSWVFLVFEGVGSRSSDNPESIVRAVIGADAPFEVQRCVPWKMTAEVASRYREGNVFLVGDAAHRFPPAGGLGMNTGLQDAHNIAWKIAAIAEGWANPSILNTYESERQAVATANSNQSQSNIETAPRLAGAMMGAAMQGDGPLPPEVAQELEAAIQGNKITFENLGMHLGFSYDPKKPVSDVPGIYVPRAHAGDRLPHAWISKQGGRSSVLDQLATDRFTLFATDAAAGFSERATKALGKVPVKVVAANSALGYPSDWLSLTKLDKPGLLLIRPDGHVMAHASGLTDEALASLAKSVAGLCG